MAETMSFQESVRWTRDVLAQWGSWTRAHWRLTLLLSVVAFVTGWAWNTYAMAVGLEGSKAEGSPTTATADGHTLNAVYWLILFTLISGVITYAWSRGWTAFRADMAILPRRFAEAMTTSRPGAFAMLLWGLSVALIIATLVESAAAIVLGLVLLALASSPIGVILTFALVRVWRGLCGILAGKANPRVDAMVNPFMVMVGEGAGLLLDGLIDSYVFKMLAAVFAALVSVTLARGSRAPGIVAVLVLAGASQLIRMRGAYADDGGWNECVTADGRPCAGLGLEGVLAWFGSPGAGHVLVRGSIGASASAVGALIGLGAGAAAAALARGAPRIASQGRPPPDAGPLPPLNVPPQPPPDPAVPEQRQRRPLWPPQPDARPPDPRPPEHHQPPGERPPGLGVPDPGIRPEPLIEPPHGHPEPVPEPQSGSDRGTVYRSSTYEPGDSGRGQIYRSAAADHGIHPIPPPPEPAPQQPPSGPHGRGRPWDDLDDFVPDAPNRELRPPRRPARPGEAEPPKAGRARVVPNDPDDGEAGPARRPRPPIPPASQ
ncbi:hypothetical protein Ade02nite_94480 [Paractinoplanes deccanensis]|uniref:Uncharacterized protein n=1 Tax=Paractinoplanes deccanensis TaxID=113561 RepID=A0ABQ3YLC9_9ACTN|nr:hypothetical protein [Actinoplanes deccanensis]GID80807.1 hypothetical protein Ade02nite_94480 [Actinoplanes deccanensis]